MSCFHYRTRRVLSTKACYSLKKSLSTSLTRVLKHYESNSSRIGNNTALEARFAALAPSEVGRLINFSRIAVIVASGKPHTTGLQEWTRKWSPVEYNTNGLREQAAGCRKLQSYDNTRSSAVLHVHG